MRPIVFPAVASRRIRLALLLWIGLEIGAFILVVRLIGPGGAVLAGLATSLLGFSQLRRAGASAMAKLRAGLGARAAGPAGARPGGGPLVDETLGTLGGLCLLLPGFLSDIVGLALAIPLLRRWLGTRLSPRLARWQGRAARGGQGGAARGGTAPHGPTTIDLDPGDWRHTEDRRRDGRRDPDATEPIPPP